MKKILIISVCMLLGTKAIIAQTSNLGLYLGAGPTRYSTIGFILGSNQHNFSFGFDIDYETFKTNGELKRDIGWNEYSEDHLKEGEFKNYFNLGYKYQLHERFLVGVQTGLGRKKLYRNCLDPTGTFGDNGRYYKKKGSGKITADLGLSINYLVPLKKETSPLMLGVQLGSQTGMIFTVGFFQLFE